MNMKGFIAENGEKPLDNMPANGGYTGIFRTIGVIGDSLASGEFEADDGFGGKAYYDAFDYSWGQVMARIAGVTVYNFSRGGMSAKEYMESFAEGKGFWDKDKKCTAYMFALGVNDLLNMGQEVGDISDVDLNDYRNNKHTFAGYYGAVIQRYLEIEPRARLFFVTMPRQWKDDERRTRLKKEHAELLHKLTEVFPRSYVIDLHKYAPVHDAEFAEKFYMDGHLNPMGYLLTGQMMCSYIDYIVRNNFDDFRQVGFVGTSLVNKKYKD